MAWPCVVPELPIVFGAQLRGPRLAERRGAPGRLVFAAPYVGAPVGEHELIDEHRG